jgi:purine catabolism regulator
MPLTLRDLVSTPDLGLRLVATFEVDAVHGSADGSAETSADDAAAEPAGPESAFETSADDAAAEPAGPESAFETSADDAAAEPTGAEPAVDRRAALDPVAPENDPLGRAITWVHVSELIDPTPFLSGGELLLTTGIAFDATTDTDEYVRRLAEAAVVGVGFGTGLSHVNVPAELIRAARLHGLPIVEVPRRTPFIAISRAVSRAIAADEYAAVTKTFTAQQALTKAALAPAGPGRLVRLLAQQIGGWVVLLDPGGAPLEAYPDGDGGRDEALAAEMTVLTGHRGSVSSGFPLGDDTVSLQSVGTGQRGRAFLAVGTAGPLSPADRHLVNAAVMLLTIRLEQSSAGRVGLGPLRSAILRLLLDGQVEVARQVADQSGVVLPPEPVRWAVGSGAARSGLERWEPLPGKGSRPPAGFVVGELDDLGVALLIDDAGLVDAIGAVLDSESPAARGSIENRPEQGWVGISEPATYAELATAHRQALQAMEFGRRNNRLVTAFAEIAMPGLSGLLAPDTAQAFADALLAPLLEHDRTGRGDLVNSLREWLAHHGQWDPSSTALGVHRHTLRHRMRTVEELLGRSLDSPGTRSELWLALEIRNQG